MIFMKYCAAIFLWGKRGEDRLYPVNIFSHFGELEMRLVWEIMNLIFYIGVVFCLLTVNL